MNIAGLQKLTLLDFPGNVACTVFLGGCNFRCPFCHNFEIVDDNPKPFMSEDEFFDFLRGRKGILDGVAITGGEPTLNRDLPEFMRRIKSMGFKVKLDTNGYRPDMLKVILNEGLADYVAMDIKNAPSGYNETSGVNVDIKRIEESITLLVKSQTDFEFRTTVISGLHNEQCIAEMAKWLYDLGCKNDRLEYFIQPFTDRDTVPTEGLSAPDKEELEKYKELLKVYFDKVSIRTME